MQPSESYHGFPLPTSNTTFVPNQLFDTVLMHASRGCVRLVAYMLRRVLGWCDSEGNPQEPHVQVSYRELELQAGIGHSMIGAAIEEAMQRRCITCLRTGARDTRNNRRIAALYELNWDERTHYLTGPDEFQGFFGGEGNRTAIPNDFFDILVPNESLAVIRVVGAVLRYTIGFQTKWGHRRQQVQMSVTELEKRTHLSREAVRKALQDSLAKNYIQLLEGGVFDPDAARLSTAATYGVKWNSACVKKQRDDVESLPDFEQMRTSKRTTPKSCMNKCTPINDHSEKLHGNSGDSGRLPLRKVARDHSEKLHGDHSEKLHGIKITRNKTYLKQQQGPSDEKTVFAAVVENHADAFTETKNRLHSMGFDHKSSELLAGRYSSEQIEQQCLWIDRRQATQNRLGMLRKSIEENWPEPQGDSEFFANTPGALFTSHFFAGLAGNFDQPLAIPSARDVGVADIYVRRLLEIVPVEKNTPDWGRAFGRFVREAERDNPQYLRSFSAALRYHGDAFYIQFRERNQKRSQQAADAEREGRETKFLPIYHEYLRRQETYFREIYLQEYTEFEAKEQEQRHKYNTGIFAKSGTIRTAMLAKFDREEERLERFRAFFQSKNGVRILSFKEWDTQENSG